MQRHTDLKPALVINVRMNIREHILNLVTGYFSIHHWPRLDRLRLLTANQIKQPVGCLDGLALPHPVRCTTYMQRRRSNDVAAVPSDIQPVAQPLDAVHYFLAAKIEYKMPAAACSVFERSRQFAVLFLQSKQAGLAGRAVNIKHPNAGRRPGCNPNIVARLKGKIDSAFVAGC